MGTASLNNLQFIHLKLSHSFGPHSHGSWQGIAVFPFSLGIPVADTAVVEPDMLNNIGLTTLAEVAAAKKKLTK